MPSLASSIPPLLMELFRMIILDLFAQTSLDTTFCHFLMSVCIFDMLGRGDLKFSLTVVRASCCHLVTLSPLETVIEHN